MQCGRREAARRRNNSSALIVQEMVYGGNIHGVATSRNFSTGANVPNIAPAFVEKFPKQAAQLKSALHKIERHFKSMQEVTFTVETWQALASANQAGQDQRPG